ncbi:unnamed protein product [Ceutorhynchus assimilis]|uniref:Endonuclease/exonuclease/phosphatase domain-containing protein n=1 Tax=Ceutorhynchus assimilis TaxID=467358 RepID=A0A9N9MFG9_9CUCU|nr:unnamed protein product [Ceutorhynchus assimilis]
MSDFPALKIAHLREYDTKNCDIRLPLTIKTKTGESIVKEICGFVKHGETLAALKNSIVENLIELNNKQSDEEDDLLLPEKITVEFLKGKKPYKDSIVLQDFNKLTDEKYIKILDQTFSIISNTPLVKIVRLPLAICVNFPVEPSVFKTYNVHKPSSKFIWLKSKDKEIWEKVGEGFGYNVTKEDANHYLKFCCIPYSKFRVKGPMAEAISEDLVDIISEFPQCPFEERHKLTNQRLKGINVRVVSYNLLADRYVDRDQFSCCPPRALGIHYRKQLTIKELKGYNADIICLQEVDEIHYRSYYLQKFKEMGYKTHFNRKGNCIPEGLVCAYDMNRFKTLDYKHLVLRTAVQRKQFHDVLTLLDYDEEVKQLFLKQNTSLQVLVLEDKNTKNILVVGNTHLYYHPDADHIRLIQAFMTTTHLGNIKNSVIREYKPNNIGIVFCGDFNSHYEKSLFGFMRTGTIDPEHKDCLKISSEGKATIYSKLYLSCASGTPKYTNYTPDFKGCLDYIFVETHRLATTRVIPVASEKELMKYIGLPNEVYPSDHLSLVVDLQFKSR